MRRKAGKNIPAYIADIITGQQKLERHQRLSKRDDGRDITSGRADAYSKILRIMVPALGLPEPEWW